MPQALNVTEHKSLQHGVCINSIGDTVMSCSMEFENLIDNSTSAHLLNAYLRVIRRDCVMAAPMEFTIGFN